MFDISIYDRHGFAVSGPVLSASELAEARETVDLLHRRALSGEDPDLAAECVFERDQPDSKRDGRSLPEDRDAVFILGDPTRFAPSLLDLLRNATLLDIVGQTHGTPDFVVHFANITSKAPSIGSGINWHRDFPNKYICPAEPLMVRTMICLDGMSEETGATQFFSGSHLPETGSGSRHRSISAACAPGAVVAIHPLVLHGGAPNASESPRRNIIVQWGAADCPLVTEMRESLTGKHVRDLKVLSS
ncbi:phytanoyl-CoA dioxygenase family protein [Nisaea acidiphila]|uniref:Phytanoyl-CoA dioxygenase family protein n=1 Tax=Nisaea acidiphila TaxID=1862145 RepID=A0A9J7ATW2_9PROT|nr:phytanoyl-CoA dioxygenase family protein [Nisaea acidiphila]UUX50800.1 phytanoyl-CoA dioxygenase family protein [Nisaea acidiphila]